MREQKSSQGEPVRVLSYETPSAQRTHWQMALDMLSQVIETVGGSSGVLFILSMCFLVLGLLFPPIAAPLLIFAGLIWWTLINRWSKSSRWF